MVTLTSLTQLCPSFPSEWQGETGTGECVYVRYRHGFLVASLAGSLDDAVSAQLSALGLCEGPTGRSEILFNDRTGGANDGKMSEQEMLARLDGVLRVAAR